MIAVERIHTFTCDWPSGCHSKLVIRGAEKIADARRRARREGWRFSHNAKSAVVQPDEGVRCPAHAYRKGTEAA